MNKILNKIISYSKAYTNNEKTKYADYVANFNDEAQLGYIYTNLCAWFMHDNICKANHIVLNDLKIFSNLLISSELSRKEIMIAIFDVIKRNIDNGILEAEQTEKLKEKFKFPSMPTFLKIIRENKEKTFFDILVNMIEIYVLTPETPEKSVRGFRGEEIKNLQELQKNYEIIQNSYLNKTNTYTEEDINQTYNALIAINIPLNICQIIKEELKRRKSKNEQKFKSLSKRQVVINPDMYKVQPINKEIVNKKEYNIIYRELLTYFDFEQMIPIKNLSLKDVIYCVHLLIKINMSENVIDKFIRIVEKQKNNPVAMYVFIYDKIQNSLSDETIATKVHLIEEYLGQLFIPESESDYEFWKECINEELANLNELIPNNHNYIMTKAKKYE